MTKQKEQTIQNYEWYILGALSAVAIIALIVAAVTYIEAFAYILKVQG